MFNEKEPMTYLYYQKHKDELLKVTTEKGKTYPAIHFVIHHPKLRDAIENFIAPVVE